MFPSRCRVVLPFIPLCEIFVPSHQPQWDEGVVKDKAEVNMHIMATVFHYGQCLFEGLKAFECKDKHIRYFQPGNDFNSKRLNRGCERLMMPEVPLDMFNDAIKKVRPTPRTAQTRMLMWCRPYIST